jgi:hypothetical protein
MQVKYLHVGFAFYTSNIPFLLFPKTNLLQSLTPTQFDAAKECIL